MKFIRRLSFLTIFIIFITYEDAQEVHYNYDRSANFGTYGTYHWAELPGSN